MSDVYCYPDSYVLKNKLDIHDKEQLLMAEIKFAAIRLYQLQEQPVRGEFARGLCLKCGYILDLTHTDHEEMLTGSIMSFDKGDNTGLEAVFRKCIRPLDS